jgi:dihydrofolate reductase
MSSACLEGLEARATTDVVLNSQAENTHWVVSQHAPVARPRDAQCNNWRETMRKIIAITQVTLDGVMQAPGGREEDTANGFSHGGWAMSFFDDTLKQVIDETIGSEFDMLLGRRTYEIFAAYWPNHGDNPIGKAFNKATKFVVTRSLNQLDWENSHPLGGDIVDEARRLKASDGPALHIWGSSGLLQTLIAADVVDEYRLWVVPVVVGGGKRLFEDGLPLRTFTLVATRSTSTGVLLNTYRPAGSLTKV